MTEVLFYHLQNMSLESVLPPLLEKSLERGWRVVVQSTSQERADALDAHLWTYRDDSFLPHVTARSGDLADQPIVLAVEEGNPNGANVRFLIDNADLPAAKLCERILAEFADVFAGDRDGTGIGTLKPSHHHQQCRFSGAGRADQADSFATADGQGHILQDMNARWATAERQVDARQGNGGHTIGPGSVVHGIPIVSWCNLQVPPI